MRISHIWSRALAGGSLGLLEAHVPVTRTIAIVAVALASLSACLLPSTTTAVEVRGTAIEPIASIFAVTEQQVEQFLSGTNLVRFADVVVSDTPCADVQPECVATLSTPRIELSIALEESLFGQTALGTYDIPGDASWDAQLEEDASAFSQDGRLELLAIDDERIVLTYEVTVAGDDAEQVRGDVVAENCPALEEHILACE